MSKTAPKTYITSGHSGCAGCCDAFAAKFTLMGAGPNCIIVNPTGCLEVMSAFSIVFLAGSLDSLPL
jgi:pyruvate ferredoxin oxidoreductase beta subunit